jgi:hypothetical protein
MKTILSLVIIIALAFLGYWYYAAPKSSTNELLVSSNASGVTTKETNAEIGRKIITLLSAMQKITLDTKIFTSSSFQSLQDFGVEIKSEIANRRDPFAPIGLENVSFSTTTLLLAPGTSPSPSPSSSPFR